MNFSHQPGEGLRAVDAACDEADRPVCRRMTLSLAGDSVPHVSYAMSKEGRGVEVYVSGRDPR